MNIKILIVEDSPYKLSKIKDCLLKNGNEIIIVTSSYQNEALDKLSNQKFDLLVLDMQLPLLIDSEPDIDAGENILLDLFNLDEKYKMPSNIIALTEYESSQNNIQEKFPDVAAIKYSNSSTVWAKALNRKVDSILKSKIDEVNKKVYCEGRNSHLLNSIGFNNIEFIGLKDCRQIYLSAKNEEEYLSIRDKDFLTQREVNKLQDSFNNYIILEYYCFENYLYHPSNIKSLQPDFKIDAYIKDLLRQKEQKLFNIIQDYKVARTGYLELNDENKKFKDSRPEDEIVESLKSSNFEEFYKFFDMAGKKDPNHNKSYKKSFLEQYNLNPLDLVKTVWMKNRISKLLEPINLK